MAEHSSNKRVKDYIIADIRRQWLARNLDEGERAERPEDEDLNIPLQTAPKRYPKKKEDISSVMASLRTVHHK